MTYVLMGGCVGDLSSKVDGNRIKPEVSAEFLRLGKFRAPQEPDIYQTWSFLSKNTSRIDDGL